MYVVITEIFVWKFEMLIIVALNQSAFSALTRLGGRKGIRPVRKNGGWWRWSSVSLDGWRPPGWSLWLPVL